MPVDHHAFKIIERVEAADAFDDLAVDPSTPNADARPAVAHVAISLGDDGGAVAPGEAVAFTCTVSVDPAAAVNTPGALLFTFGSEPLAPQGGVRKGGWITDVTYDSAGSLNQPTVATETITIAHEGFLLI
jgi:hypothetical protein